MVVIISTLALIASPYLTGASSKAKLTAVKGNVSSGAITASVLMNMDDLPPEKAVPAIIQKGNFPEGATEASEAAFTPSPFDGELKAYGGKGPGQVDVIVSEEPYGVLLQGYDQKGNPIPTARKFVPFNE